jgi:hypothetical protein
MILKKICSIVILLAVSFNVTANDVKVSSTRQFVFDIHAGNQFTILNSIHDYQMCAVSYNDGDNSALIFIDKSKTSIDVAFEYDGDDYKTKLIILCTPYTADEYFVPLLESEKLERSISRVVKKLGGYQFAPDSDGEQWGSSPLYLKYAIISEVDDQYVGEEFEIHNTSENDTYGCFIKSRNSSSPVYFISLPNSITSFHVLAQKNGKMNSDSGCAGNPINSDLLTVKEIYDSITNVRY